MILFCDEDVGKGIPLALRLVGCQTKYMYEMGWAGKPDTKWLEDVGGRGWLVFSYNKKILRVPEERDTLIKGKVGAIFLTTGQEYARNVLRVLLSRWDSLESLDSTESKPFVRFLLPSGRLVPKYKDFPSIP